MCKEETVAIKAEIVFNNKVTSKRKSTIKKLH
jgi:hypothetical protein